MQRVMVLAHQSASVTAGRKNRSSLTIVQSQTLTQGHLLSRYIIMVCDKCQKKLGKVITPDPWKSGARNTNESGGRKIGENKALTASRARFNPYTSKFENCKICRQKVHQAGSNYCQACAYKKGICAMCGKKLLDTKNYKQSSA